jgi:hypothetical protein
MIVSSMAAVTGMRAMIVMLAHVLGDATAAISRPII